ncbi:GNAT family N-acetyltransferase [Streptomyces sp. NPDC019443]|uniref:GNAT family N-acetyltransferase n=1 Tax=Streptomyces sp. NPDC019443 TaxID=3365061 RepID=UPI0037B5AFA0
MSPTPAGQPGFPSRRIDAGHAVPAVEALMQRLAPETSRLVMAFVDEELTGWLNIRRNTSALIAHWGTLRHVQTHPRCSGRGIGSALMTAARQIARQDMDLEQLHLAARGGMGLEDFYGRLGVEGGRPLAGRPSLRSRRGSR